ncbi:piezo-type mechanosensitive ion channel component 2-like isoform X4 [Lineus longissimus]|uniref:piezo-type mechanosensitive ion channel component 2-like isoform X4 n=1 Tax=Lineus longissimus TaxID=88925 RepID=UPI00315C6584
MAANTLVVHVLFQGLLPVSLLAATIFRYNALSFIYGVFLLLCPLLKAPTRSPMPGCSKAYLILLVIASTLFTIGHAAFQGFLLLSSNTSNERYGFQFTNCSFDEAILRQFGFQSYMNVFWPDIIRHLAPDVLMVVISVIVLTLCSKFARTEPETDAQHVRTQKRSTGTDKALKIIGEVLTLIFLTASAIIYPSVTSAVYFVSFIYIATWLSCYKTLGEKFAGFRIFLLLYSGLHLLTLHLYQFQFFQELLPYESLYARLFGLTNIVQTDCSIPAELVLWQPVKWTYIVSPCVILILYWVLACDARAYRHRKDHVIEEDPQPDESVRADLNIHSSRVSHHRKKGLLRRSASSGSEHQVLQDARQEKPRTQPPEIKFKNLNTSLMEDAERQSNYDTLTPVTDMVQDGAPEDAASNEITEIPEEEEEKEGPKKKLILVTIGHFILSQSYVATLIVMMAWSITYHCWLTFVYLLAACIIWMIPKPNRVVLNLSPIILAYAEILIIIQYIYGLNLTSAELPEKIDNFDLAAIGLIKYEYPCGALAVQVAFTVMFWLNLCQFMRERYQRQQVLSHQGVPLQTVSVENSQPSNQLLPDTASPEDSVSGKDNPRLLAIGEVVWKLLSRYWILICIGMFLVQTLQPDVVVYRIIYMAFFLYFLVTFQLCYRWWRLSLLAFWWIIIIYSMLVLCIIYTYQFEDFPEYWHNGTGLSMQLLHDLGLQQYDTATLFVKLLTPTAFLIVIILQVNYFHQTFMSLTALDRYKNRSRRRHGTGSDLEASQGSRAGHEDDDHDQSHGTDPERRYSMARREKYSLAEMFGIEGFTRDAEKFMGFMMKNTNKLWKLALWIVWRLLEIHVFKLVVFAIIMVCVFEVTAINFLFLLFLAILTPIVQLRALLSGICMIWASLVILAKMTFQLHILDTAYWLSNCSSIPQYQVTSGNSSYPFNETIDNAKWVGLEKRENIALYVVGLVCLILALGFEAVVKIHQKQISYNPEVPRPKPGIIFPDTRREDADKGIIPCLKFFTNYFFYKFGLEANFMMIAITIVIRGDSYAVMYAVILGILLICSRRACARFWPVLIIILVIVLILQYASCLGLPPGLCIEYPWTAAIHTILEQWMKLPDYEHPPYAKIMLADFFTFLFACLQWRVFKIERSALRDIYGGGDNTALTGDIDESEPNPTQDFISQKMSLLDYSKSFIFLHMFWLTLLAIFVTALQRVSLFCLGYMIGCFAILWFGQNLLLRPRTKLLRVWGFLLAYNYTVILCRTFLQVIGCVYFKALHTEYCPVTQLLTLVCQSGANQVADDSYEPKCEDPDGGGLGWDVVCLVFILIQRRAYCTHYFRHVVIELEVQNKLSSRGAQLINCRLVKEVRDYHRKEAEHLAKIKRKMDMLKKKQEESHEKALFTSKDHYKIIRSGDYQLFEDVDEEDTFWDEEEEEKPKDKKAGPLQPLSPLAIMKSVLRFFTPAMVWNVLNAALEGGTKAGLEVAKQEKVKALEEEAVAKEPMKKTRTSSSASDRDKPVMERAPEVVEDQPTGEEAPKEKSTDGGEDTDGEVSKSGADGVDGIDGVDGVDEQETADAVTDVDEDEESKVEETCYGKIKNTFFLIWALFISLIESFIKLLNRISFDYRVVANQLEIEKREEKEKIALTKACAEPITEVSEDEAVEREAPRAESETMDDEDSSEIREVEKRKAAGPGKEVTVITPIKGDYVDIDEIEMYDGMDDVDEDVTEIEKEPERLLIFRLILAIYHAVVSRSEIVCYFVIILNHMNSASLLTLVIPMSIFLWAMLSVPRPSKMYWTCVITYIEGIMLIKYLFQFEFFPWNEAGKKNLQSGPFWPPRIIGIEMRSDFALYDLALLLCIFIHRSILKRYGLWKDAHDATAELEKYKGSRSTIQSLTPERRSMSKHSTPEKGTGANGGPEGEITDGEQPLSLDEVNEKEEGKAKRSSEQRFEDCIMRCCSSFFQPWREFFTNMTCGKFRTRIDVYTVIFFCDIVTFLIVVFGYSSFGPASAGEGGDVNSFLSENKIPGPFLAMLLIQFVFIVIDRALYLKKFVLGKFVFQITLVIVIHLWMFFILPLTTERKFVDNLAAKLWYFTKCVYFGFSATQITSGYPTRILGNILTKGYSMLNKIAFKIFLAIPFLLELRTLMDWIWTDTTLDLLCWLTMEDIFANIFLLTCERHVEANYPTARAVKKRGLMKFLIGGIQLAGIIFIIWFPLLLFSLASVISVPYPPYDCTVQIRIGGYEPIFQMSAQQQFINTVTPTEFDNLKFKYTAQGDDKGAVGFFTNYDNTDVRVITILGNSSSAWSISSPSQKALRTDLLSPNPINVYFDISFTREVSMTKDAAVTARHQAITPLAPGSPTREKIAHMLDPGSDSKGAVKIMELFPRFYRVYSNGEARPARQLLDNVIHLSNATLQLRNGAIDVANVSVEQQWWEVRELMQGTLFLPDSKAPEVPTTSLTVVAFSDRASPQVLSFIPGSGTIIGIYVSFILLIGKFLRTMFTGMKEDAKYRQMPYVDRIRELCFNIYLARESHDFALEEELFAKLVFVYRSPETMIKWSRYPKEKTE